MTANLLLAALPLLLAWWLFGRSRKMSFGWWTLVAAFVAFLPNAPYVLTDAVHFNEQVGHVSTRRGVLALSVQYSLLMGAGVLIYGACIALVRHRLVDEGAARLRWPVEIGLHALCSVGIFLGRVVRLNSWDIVLRPGNVLRYLRVPEPRTMVIIAFTFCVLTAATAALRVPVAIHGLRRSAR